MRDELKSALRVLWAGDPQSPSRHGKAVAETLEHWYQIRLPEDFRDYLVEAAPATDWEDEHGMTYWEPLRIKNIPDEFGHEEEAGAVPAGIASEIDTYLLFVDFLDWCNGYAICCSEGSDRGKVAIIDLPHPKRFVASSFCSFLRLASEHSPRLHSPVGDAFTDVI